MSPADWSAMEFNLQNRYAFLGLDNFTASWTVLRNGCAVADGALEIPALAAGEDATVKVPYSIPADGAEYAVNFDFYMKDAAMWCAAGYNIASHQFVAPGAAALTNFTPEKCAGSVEVSETATDIEVRGKGFI